VLQTKRERREDVSMGGGSGFFHVVANSIFPVKPTVKSGPEISHSYIDTRQRRTKDIFNIFEKGSVFVLDDFQF